MHVFYVEHVTHVKAWERVEMMSLAGGIRDDFRTALLAADEHRGVEKDDNPAQLPAREGGAAMEKWAEDLSAAHDAPTLHDAIVNADPHCVAAFMQRHGMSDPGKMTDRAKTILSALEAGTLTKTDLVAWIEEIDSVLVAVDGINDFREKNQIGR